MPRIPNYTESVGPSSTPQATSNVRATPDAFGAGVGRALEGAGNELQVMAKEIKQENDATQVMEADLALSEWEQDFLHDPDKGLYGTLGKNALGATRRTAENFDKVAGEIMDGLGNPDQKRAFQRMIISRRGSAMRGASNHETSQRKNWIKSTTEAGVSKAVQGAIANYTDPELIGSNVARGETYLRATGKTLGKSADEINLQIEAMKTEAHAGVIERYLNESPAKAKEYFESVKDDISPSAINAIEDKLKSHIQKEEAQNKADEIITTTDDLDEQLEKARDIDDADIRDDVVSRIKTRHSESKEIERIENERVIDEAWQTIEETTQNGSRAEALDLIPAGIDQKEKARMRKFILNPTTTTDWEYYEDLSNMPPEELKDHKIDITRLSAAHRKQFLDDQAEAKQGKVPVIGDIAGMANEFMDFSGIKGKKNRGQFRNALRAAVEREALAKGKDKLSFEEKQKVMDQLVMKVQFEKLGPDKKVSIFKLTGDEDMSKVVVPSDSREKILKLIQSKTPDRHVTDEQIRNIYLKALALREED